MDLTDGQMMSKHVGSVRGTVANPMSDDEVKAKAQDQIASTLGAAPTAKLIDLIYALETVKDIRELRPLLQIPLK